MTTEETCDWGKWSTGSKHHITLFTKNWEAETRQKKNGWIKQIKMSSHLLLVLIPFTGKNKYTYKTLSVVNNKNNTRLSVFAFKSEEFHWCVVAQVWHIQGTDVYESSDIVVVYICVLDHSSYFNLLCIALCLIVVTCSGLSHLLCLLW